MIKEVSTPGAVRAEVNEINFGKGSSGLGRLFTRAFELELLKDVKGVKRRWLLYEQDGIQAIFPLGNDFLDPLQWIPEEIREELGEIPLLPFNPFTFVELVVLSVGFDSKEGKFVIANERHLDITGNVSEFYEGLREDEKLRGIIEAKVGTMVDLLVKIGGVDIEDNDIAKSLLDRFITWTVSVNNELLPELRKRLEQIERREVSSIEAVWFMRDLLRYHLCREWGKNEVESE